MRALRASAIAIVGLTLAACLPDPQSVKEHREKFSRSGLKGEFLLETLPANAHPVNAVFGNKIKLLAYSIEPEEPKRGTTPTIKLYWTALTPVNEDYQIFVHGDAIVGQARRIHVDHWPAREKYSTAVWREGEIVVDPFGLPIDHDYGPKQIGVYVGMYLDDFRLPLTDRGVAPSDGDNRSMPLVINLP